MVNAFFNDDARESSGSAYVFDGISVKRAAIVAEIHKHASSEKMRM